MADPLGATAKPEVKRIEYPPMEWSQIPCWADLESNITKFTPTASVLVAEPPQQQLGPVKFTIQPELNKKIFFWKGGDIVRLSVDTIVNSTNETLDERNGISERIISSAGEGIHQEIRSLEGCRTGEAKMTAGFLLPARHVIHTVGPRYNIKYKTAAESALHSCYRSSMELAKEAGLTSIGFAVVNSVRRGYPPEAGAHMALRTIRRFLEKFGSGIDAVILVTIDEIDTKAYETTLPLYFPRTEAELEYSRRHLPDDIGNEYGEPVQIERKIRIGDIPRPSSNFLNESMVGEDNPLSSWDNPNREPEMPPIDKQKLVNMLAQVRGDHDAIRKEKINSKIPTSQDEATRRYQRWLRQAEIGTYPDLESRNVLFTSGVDKLGRVVVCVVAKNYSTRQIVLNDFMLYIIYKLDAIANKDYVVVFFNTDSTSENRPDFSFFREVYNLLHPKYRRNLKTLFIVHPTWWVRFSIIIMNTFFTSDIREKIKMIDRLVDLYEFIPASALKVPDFVVDYDVRVNGPLAVTQPTVENQDSL